MRHFPLFVLLTATSLSSAANLSPLEQKALDQLDATQQQRQQALEVQKSNQFSAQSDVQFDKPPSSEFRLPVAES
ncbi:ShlB/FhaC/HecB family hemolysin secretion/activation protein, partial [Pasteurella oralis]